jgi:glycosyltransferase involved in cell wall biosynthesis
MIKPNLKIPISERKKILLLSDDIRTFSGIATVSRELIMGTCEQFNWVQLASSPNNSDEGQIFDLSHGVFEEYGLTTSVKLYGSKGYGDPQKLREIIRLEKPDAIIHFTDPRYWDWLYMMEDEIRSQIPLMYLNIWDDLPDPQYNETAYASCDLLYAISKQTYGINKRVLERINYNVIDEVKLKKTKSITGNSVVLSYLPHGINEESFNPVSEDSPEYIKFKKEADVEDSEFIIFWNNRNMYRKQVGSVILGYRQFYDNVKRLLGNKKASKIKLILHTLAAEPMGTDIPALIKSLAPDCNIKITNGFLTTDQLNYLYNLADVTVNITSNEGFGLGTAESLMAGTPIIVNVTGGLQDQCGFKNKDGKYLTEYDYVKIKSLHKSKDLYEHGKWVYPIYPSNITLQGSVPTPYIHDDRANSEDLALALSYFYSLTRSERKELGKLGREYLLDEKTLLSANNMCNKFIEITLDFLSKWKPKDKFVLVNTNTYLKDRKYDVYDTNIINPINNEAIENNILKTEL